MYVVKKKFQRGTEITVGSPFKSFAQAKNYVDHELHNDALMKIDATYVIYEGADPMQTFTQRDLENTSKDESSSSSQQGATSRQTFSPTPLNMAPRPKGLPHSWLKDEDEDKQK